MKMFYSKKLCFSAKAFYNIKILCCNFSSDQKSRGHGMVCEVKRLEVCVGDGDSSQLNYLRVGHTPPVVASRDGLVIADIKASP